VLLISLWEATEGHGALGSLRSLLYIGPMVRITLGGTGPARDREIEAVRHILRESGLPDAGILAVTDTLLVARVGDEIVGSAALEPYPPAALLRSVAVQEAWRGVGVGGQLTEAALSLAADLGCERVYLLTETASQFFSAFGFRRIEREEVDAPVRRSQEFTSLCPDSADVLVLDMNAWKGKGGKQNRAPETD